MGAVALGKANAAIRAAKPCGCFVAGTAVYTDRGALPIEQLRTGSLVWAKEVSTGKVELKAVLDLYRRDDRPTLDVFVARTDGIERLRTTDDHPFWTQRGWVTVESLEPGDQILFGSGEWGSVDHVARTGLEETVYNIEVDEYHSYYVGNFATLVHNGPCKVPPKVGTTKHIKLNKADNGSYTTTHQSGKKYHGKGSTDRARRSARRVSRDNNDPVKDIDHTPAATDADAFAQEAQRLNADGGPLNPNNYNKINSPGSSPQ